ncbi:MAG: fumarylacetoacetate hydrolase family protein [Candidatus Bipolaricaulaceae bacterium]
MYRARFTADGLTVVGEVRGDRAVGRGRSWPLGGIRLHPPVLPTKIVCVGRNYAAHAHELGRSIPDRPLLFFKPPSALVGPDQPVVLPPSRRVDYEGELAVVIGRRCRRVPARCALEVVLGYTCLNDVTDRQAQQWEQNWVRAKGFDTACPLGPWMATPEELAFPLVVETRVNGELRQRGSTDEFMFSIPEIIAEVSRVMTLEVGDVIATGTPPGVGPLSPGDTVEVEISGIGTLRNPVQGPAG